MSQSCPGDCPLRPGVFTEAKDEALALPVASYEPEQAKVVQRRVAKDIYKPVREWQTRIVVLSETSPSDELRAELRTVDLIWGEGVVFHDTQERTDFTALSYTWGDPIFAQRLILTDVAYPITENLYVFLRRCLQCTGIRRLWIDAVCINQHDDAEKSMQVANMLSIYRKASAVQVWLGEAGASTSLALAYLEHKRADLAHHHEHCKAKFAELCEASWDTLAKPDNGSLEPLSDQSSVTQADMDLRSIASFVKNIQRGDQDVIYDRREDGAKSPFIGCWKNDIVTLLRDAVLSQCSVGVDRVYGLLGMTQIETRLNGSGSGAASGLVLDYSRPVAAVFADLAKYIMRRERSVSSILCLQASFGGDGLASWVPDWRKDTSWKPFLFAEYLIRGQDRTENVHINGDDGITEDDTQSQNPTRKTPVRLSNIPAFAPRLGHDFEINVLRLVGYTIAIITADHCTNQTDEIVDSALPEEDAAKKAPTVPKRSRRRIAAPLPTGELEFSPMFSEYGHRNERKVLKLVSVDSSSLMPVSRKDFLSSPYGTLLAAADKSDAAERVNLFSMRLKKHRRKEARTVKRLGEKYDLLEELYQDVEKTYKKRYLTSEHPGKAAKRTEGISERRIESQKRLQIMKSMSRKSAELSSEKRLASTYLKESVLDDIRGRRQTSADHYPEDLSSEPANLKGKASDLLAQRDIGKGKCSFNSDKIQEPSDLLDNDEDNGNVDEWEDDSGSFEETYGDVEKDDGSDETREEDAADDDEDNDSSSDDTSVHSNTEDKRSHIETGSDYIDEENDSFDGGYNSSTVNYDGYHSTSDGEDPPDPWYFDHVEAFGGWRNKARREPSDAFLHYSFSILNKLCNAMDLSDFATCHNAAIGDIIVVVEGCVLPIVLRPLPSQGRSAAQAYTFVGIAMLSYNSIPRNASTAEMPEYSPERFFRPQLAMYAHWQALLLAHVKAGNETEFSVV